MELQGNPSETERLSISCPDCGQEADITIWTILNAQDDPEAAAHLADGTLSEFACPQCGYRTIVDHPCLYIDPEHGLFVYNVCGDSEMTAQAIEALDALQESMDNAEHCSFRIVNSRGQLSDKAAIFLAGFNDKAMEMLKLNVLGHAQDEGRLSEDDPCAVHFVGCDDTGLRFQLQTNELDLLGSVSEEAYQLLVEALKYTDVALIHPYTVDPEWAFSALQALEPAD